MRFSFSPPPGFLLFAWSLVVCAVVPIGAVSALQSFIKITREIHGTVKSLRVTFAAWEKTFEDQQALQTGAAFRPIPTAPVSLIFLEEFK